MAEGEPFLFNIDRGNVERNRSIITKQRAEPQLIETVDSQGMATQRDVKAAVHSWALWKINCLAQTDPEQAEYHSQTFEAYAKEESKVYF